MDPGSQKFLEINPILVTLLGSSEVLNEIFPDKLSVHFVWIWECVARPLLEDISEVLI